MKLSTVNISVDDLVTLLQLDFANDQKIKAASEIGLDLYDFTVDILTWAIDALGFPEDDTVRAHLEGRDYTYCRDYITNKYEDLVKTGTREELVEFLEWAFREVNDLREKGWK